MNIPADAYPLASRMADEVLSLPMGPHLSVEDVQRVIGAIQQWRA